MAIGKKTGGRKKGTPNRLTGSIRAAITDAVTDYYNSEQFHKDIAALEPRERVSAYDHLAAYAIPKLQATELEVSKDTTSRISERLIQLSGGDKKG